MTRKTQIDGRWSDPNRFLRSSRWFRLGLLFLMQLVFCVQAVRAFGDNRPPKDLEEAEKWFQHDMEDLGCKNVQFRLDEGLVTWKNKEGQEQSINLARATTTGIHRESSGAWRVKVTFYVGDDWWWQHPKRDRAERFEQSLRFLAQQAIRRVEARMVAALTKFQTQAEAWRNLAVKPKMPDDAYAHKVLAENAYREKDLPRAQSEYEKALEKFPTWPEGQFNAALICGELKYYRNAALHMREYLALVPDAADAQAAKDKIIIWQDKTTHP